MRLQLFIFISSALLIYFGIHTLLFFLLTKFFSPKTRSAQFGLALVLLLLALSFITAFIWTQFSPHKFLHGFYYGTAIWLGTMVNLLLIYGAGLLLFIVLHAFFPGIERKTFSLFLLGLVILYTSYGLYHAGQLKTKFLSLPVKNAPGDWKGKKIAQVSDVHLGIMNGEKLSRKIAALIDQQKVDFVFITGDLFDGVGDDLAKLIEPLDRINAPIFYITGNHETYLGIDKAISAISKTKIRLLRDEIVDLGGIQLIGIDYPPRGWKKDIKPVLERMDQTKPAILLYHEPARIETAKAYNISLQLSGHTHNGQMWPMKIFTSLIYQGFDYGLHQMGDFALYTTSGAGTWGPPMRIGSTAEVVIITIQ
jgi:predicted MPP superfamily phosphohydrolase